MKTAPMVSILRMVVSNRRLCYWSNFGFGAKLLLAGCSERRPSFITPIRPNWEIPRWGLQSTSGSCYTILSNHNGLKWKFVISFNGFDQNNSLELINRASRSFKLQFFQFLPNLTLFRPQSFFWKALKWSQTYANGLKWEFVISFHGFYQNSSMIRPSNW